MTSVDKTKLGTLDLLDLDLIGEREGRDFLPFPFRYTRPTRFAYIDQTAAYAASIPDRLRTGDLAAFTRFLDALNTFDIQVSCHVQPIGSDVACTRLLGVRCGLRGFFALQQPLVDEVDVYTVSPYDLGAVIAAEVDLGQPGRHRRIVVPEFDSGGVTEIPPEGGSVAVRQSGPDVVDVRVPSAAVSSYATVQSRWLPARRWGVDDGVPMAAWLSVIDDGDYMYTPDRTHAIPLTRDALRERIDRLIAADIAMLKESREDVDEASWS